MSLDIGDALGRGYRRTTDSDGLRLVALAAVFSLVDLALGAGQPRRIVPEGTPVEVRPAPLVEVSVVLDAVLSLLVALATLFVSIAALRVFVEAERATIPTETFTDNALWAAANLVAGGIVFGVAVVLGLLLFVLPGLFLLVSLVFWDVYVAVENDSFVTGFRRSWELTSGNRLSLFGLGVVYVVLAGVVIVVVGASAFLLGPLGVLLTAGLNAVLSVFASAVLASAYRQLTAETPEPTSAGDL